MRVMSERTFNTLCSLFGEPSYGVLYEKILPDGRKLPPIYVGNRNETISEAKRKKAVVTVTFTATFPIYNFRERKAVKKKVEENISSMDSTDTAV